MNQKKLPIGIENFEEIRRESFYYIDMSGIFWMNTIFLTIMQKRKRGTTVIVLAIQMSIVHGI